MTLTLESSAFKHNEPIPTKYTCQGTDLSPPLRWHNAPAQTKSFVLLVEDPDATNGLWIHWALFNIESNITHLTENCSTPEGAISGLNTWGKNGYGGPCPPTGTHRYFFKLYALDNLLPLSEQATHTEIIAAMNGHILDECELIGLYKKI